MHPDGAGGLHIIPLADTQHLRPHQPCWIRPGAKRNRKDDDGHGWADGADEGERQKEIRHDLEGVGNTHQRLIYEATGKSGNCADDGADHEGGGGSADADEQGCLRTVGKSRQYIAAQPVGAEGEGGVGEGRDERLTDDRQRVTGKQKGSGERRHS